MTQDSPIITSTMTASREWKHRRATGAPSEEHELPQPGWYRVRLVKGGVWAPIRFWIVEHRFRDSGALAADTEYHGVLTGERLDPVEVFRTWERHGLMAQAIEPSEYAFLSARADHAKAYTPNSPHADPRQRTDWFASPTPF